jgi:alpha-L-fucosidase
MNQSLRRAACLLAMYFASSALAAPPDDPRMSWWREARFGLFIHFGLYAVPAGEWGGATHYGEWIRDTARIDVAEYDRFLERFDPEAFDAKEWARLAKEAGMGYVVITTKHHDGFALFDSKHSDFDVAATPFRRDIMKELADAVRAAGMKMGWYHSIMDWHHPDYLPRRPWEKERSSEGADFERFVQYLHAQVEELLTRYGEIGVMWFDGEWESTWNHDYGKALYDHCRALAPNVIVNNRVDKGRGGMAGLTVDEKFRGDFGTPEQEIPEHGLPGVDWETCMTMNWNWGYNAADQNWKSSRELIRTLVDVASKGGNFLLNVGPRADGTFPPPCVERLQAIGRWMKVHGESIHGTQASPFGKLPFGRATMKAQANGATTLYLHVFERPADGVLVLSGLANAPRAVRLLGADDVRLVVEHRETAVAVTLPQDLPDADCAVVALEIEGPPVVYTAPRFTARTSKFVTRALVEVLRSPADAAHGIEVRYTTDGTPPSATSPRYERPIEISETTTLLARTFVAGKPVSEIASVHYPRVAPLPSRAVTAPRPGLRVTRYSGEYDRIPDFSTLAAERDYVAPSIALERNLDERFALVFEGLIHVDTADVHRFELTSDDGSRLFVAGTLVVDNDGAHGSRAVTGEIALAAGHHEIRVEYFNRTGSADLGLRVAASDGEFTAVTPQALAHEPKR